MNLNKNKNWLDMPIHPADQWVFIDTTPSDLELFRRRYDTIMSKLDEQSQFDLIKMIDWIRTHLQD